MPTAAAAAFVFKAPPPRLDTALGSMQEFGRRIPRAFGFVGFGFFRGPSVLLAVLRAGGLGYSHPIPAGAPRQDRAPIVHHIRTAIGSSSTAVKSPAL